MVTAQWHPRPLVQVTSERRWRTDRRGSGNRKRVSGVYTRTTAVTIRKRRKGSVIFCPRPVAHVKSVRQACARQDLSIQARHNYVGRALHHPRCCFSQKKQQRTGLNMSKKGFGMFSTRFKCSRSFEDHSKTDAAERPRGECESSSSSTSP